MGKWIGQHIYDLVARFRNDVYLEGISTSTETDMLVVDSNNKVSKRAIDAITVDVSDFMTNGVDNRVLTATGADAINAEANLTFDGSTLSIEADSNTTANALFIDMNSITTGSALFVDVDDALTTPTTARSLISIDYDKSGATANLVGSTTTGLKIDMDDSATNNGGAIVQMVGAQIDINSANTTSTNKHGLVLNVADDGVGNADNTKGIIMTVMDGGKDMIFKSSAVDGDDCTWQTGTNGATTITTHDSDNSNHLAHFKVQADGNITLDPSSPSGSTVGTIALEANTTVTGDLTVNGDTVTFESANQQDPIVTLKNTKNDEFGSELHFVKDKGAAAGGDDQIGLILWKGDNAVQEQTNYVRMTGSVQQEADGDEAGSLMFEVATSNGTTSSMAEGLIITGTAATNILDVQIASGATSTTTVRGSLKVVTGIELGHASDTTIARVASGIASIEGANISTHSLTLKILPSAFQINDDVGRPVFVEDDGFNTLGVRCFSTTDEMYAWKEIPAGFKVTHVQVHASASTSSAVTVRSYNYQTGADNNVAETTADFNENKAITNIPASSTQDLVVKCTPASGSTVIFGASITIATI